MPCNKFNPENDIPDLAGKVILITGGTAGLGKESLLALAKHNPGHLYFTGRNEKSAEEVTSAINTISSKVPVTFLKADLADLSSIKTATQKFLSTEKRLDIFIGNAGIMAVPAGTTKDGYEIQFGTNHVGHAALIKLLLPVMLKTAEQPNSDVRIVLLTSTGHGMHPKGGILFNSLKSDQSELGAARAWLCYGQSKLANVLYPQELAVRYPSITSVAVHPGVVGTGLVSNLGFMHKALVYATNLGKLKTPEKGAYNQVWAATAPKGDVVNGGYYEPVGVKKTPVREGSNKELAKRLWEWTEEKLKDLAI
jgi:NAD(P)-dependent dehydrogenase (short-subunit alcohol dehydrogenase family)